MNHMILFLNTPYIVQSILQEEQNMLKRLINILNLGVTFLPSISFFRWVKRVHLSEPPNRRFWINSAHILNCWSNGNRKVLKAEKMRKECFSGARIRTERLHYPSKYFVFFSLGCWFFSKKNLACLCEEKFSMGNFFLFYRVWSTGMV